MAKPIEPTPVLSGEDAEALLDQVANAKYSPEKAKVLARARAAYAWYIEGKR